MSVRQPEPEPPGRIIPAVPLLAAAFAGGTAASFLLGGPWWASTLVAGAVCGALMLLARPGIGALLVVIAAAALAGAGHERATEAGRQPDPLAGQLGTHEVVGVLRDDPEFRGTAARIDLDIEKIDGAASGGGLRVTTPAPKKPLRAGDRVVLTGIIEAPPELDSFDYAGYLRSRDLHAVVSFPVSFEVVGRQELAAPRRQLTDLRQWATENIERALPEPDASLAAGVLLGQRRSMPSGLAEDLRATGTTHLVVVSGQNIGLLMGAAVALLGIGLTRRHAAVVALGLLPAYVVLVGAEPPVLRAALMAVGIVLAALSGRRTPGWLFLLYAVALLLAVDPLLADDVAFQLSASATAGVLLLATPLRDFALGRLGQAADGVVGGLVEAGAVATGAALAVLPVQAATFGELSLIQVPANVIVAPLYEAVLLVALAAALLGGIPIAGEPVTALGAFATGAFIEVVGALADLPGATVTLAAPALLGTAWLAALGGLAWLLGRVEPSRVAARRGWSVATMLLAIIAAGLWATVLRADDGLASVTVLDVGQGQAVLLRDGGQSVLVDVGPPDGAAVRALSRVGIGHDLDAVVLTHGDADHTGGLREVLRRFDVGGVLSGDADVEGVAIDIGDRIHVSDRMVVEVLSPPLVTADRRHHSDNDRSLVLLVRIGDRAVLLPADIEESAEEWLVASGYDLRSDAVIVPHHGSATSSTVEFIESVSPSVAIVSAGAGNPFGHPRAEVLDRYGGVLVFRTDEDGDVTLRSDGERLWVQANLD